MKVKDFMNCYTGDKVFCIVYMTKDRQVHHYKCLYASEYDSKFSELQVKSWKEFNNWIDLYI